MKNRYQTPLPSTWFMQRPGYLRFMVRESTAIPITLYLVVLLVWLQRLGEGPEAYAALMETFRSPAMIGLHMLLLFGALYHSITWFNLTPKVMPMYFREEKVPDAPAAVAMGYLPWFAVTGALLWAGAWLGGAS